MTGNIRADIGKEAGEQASPDSTISLSEKDSKDILGRFGIPVVKEVVVETGAQAVVEARKIGYPVVVKGLGSNLAHKTEAGLVKLNLHTDDDVRNAFRNVKETAGSAWEGCLVQPLITGKREFVAGMFRESQFGACIMFGLGGVFTEALKDITFRVAPVTRNDALDMIQEIRASSLLGAFRGEAAANRDQLTEVITGLSRLADEHPEIVEVDINPLIVQPDGSVTAVDALVVQNRHADVTTLQEDRDKPPLTQGHAYSPAEIRKALDVMTNATSVAVVGATRTRRGHFPGMFGCMRNFGYPGKLYPINPNADEIDGLKAYPNLASLPEPVDLVIIAVPAKFVPDALRDCAASGNRNIHILTSGFRELQDDDGMRLHREIEDIARKGGLHVVGPNCMGLYVPARKMVTWVGAPELTGPVSMISQSGGNVQELTHFASRQYRLYFNKVISYGNALTLDSTDFLDYLSRDDATRMITMYIEGVKDGRRLLELVRRTNMTKPVIILKSGLTDSGARAISSHTGAMAGDRNIWKAFFRQTGATQVDSIEEMADTAAVFHYIGHTQGRRVGIMTVGGGAGVAMTDICAGFGMTVPALSAETVDKLKAFIPPQGNILQNPIDSVFAFNDLGLLGKTLDILARGDEIDNIVVSLPLDWLYDDYADKGMLIEQIARYLAGEGRDRLCGKPMMVVWRQFRSSDEIRKMVYVMEDILLEAGIPVFEGLQRAIAALSKLARYSEFQRRGAPS